MEQSSYLHAKANMLDKFKRMPFLQSFDEEDLQHVLTLSKLRSYSAGEVITLEGCYDSWIYLIISGRVRILSEGKEIAQLANTGDTFGELTVLDGEACSASVEAINDVVCLAIDASILNHPIKNKQKNTLYCVFYRLFAEVLAQRLRTTNDELISVKAELQKLQLVRSKTV